MVLALALAAEEPFGPEHVGLVKVVRRAMNPPDGEVKGGPRRHNHARHKFNGRLRVAHSDGGGRVEPQGLVDYCSAQRQLRLHVVVRGVRCGADRGHNFPSASASYIGVARHEVESVRERDARRVVASEKHSHKIVRQRVGIGGDVLLLERVKHVLQNVVVFQRPVSRPQFLSLGQNVADGISHDAEVLGVEAVAGGGQPVEKVCRVEDTVKGALREVIQ